jgi:D-arabinose 1-dehydrogenase-like Zn-dependent alcohol dehydrogenase
LKAAIVEKANLLAVREVPDPRPGEYEALCEMQYGSTCTGTDTHIIQGVFPYPVSYPAILGHESVGRVVSVGRKVRNLMVGNLVTRVCAPPARDGAYSVAWGGFAEYGLAKDHWAMRADGLPESDWAGSRFNQVVPASVDPKVAPMFTTWRETLSYISRMGVGAGSRVLVIGSGGNGLAYVAHSVNLGAESVWMVGAARCEQASKKCGAHGFIDYTRADCTELLTAACPKGFDVMIEAVGKMDQSDSFLPLLSPGGKLGIYGIDDLGQIRISPHRARGTFTLWSGGYDESETHQTISEWVLQGRLDAGAWYDVNRPYPLAMIGEAFKDLGQRKAVKALIQLSK